MTAPSGKQEGTARPWKRSHAIRAGVFIVNEDREVVAITNSNDKERDEANCAIILRAVNSFDTLVESLDSIVKMVESLGVITPSGDDFQKANKTIQVAKDAIAQAKKGA